MPDMPDVTRSARLAESAETLRTAVETLLHQLSDEGMRDLIRRSVLYEVELVHTLLLRTGSAVSLQMAEIILRGAQQQFDSLSRLIDSYGGPNNVITIG